MNPDIRHVMIDIETLGVTAGCVILSIGATMFNERGLIDNISPFYSPINWPSCEELGFSTDEATLEWWNKQSVQAAQILVDAKSKQTPPIVEVLASFQVWLAVNGFRPQDFIWANGAGFDFPILNFAYIAAGWRRAPWRYSQERDYRTLKGLFSYIERAKDNETAHHALRDAEDQAIHAAAILAEISQVERIEEWGRRADHPPGYYAHAEGYVYGGAGENVAKGG